MDATTDAMCQEPSTRRACLVDGCPCKDARIVSRRHAAFVAAMAASRGQTADRAVSPEDGWRWSDREEPLVSADRAIG
jgi:hypothetical protein